MARRGAAFGAALLLAALLVPAASGQPLALPDVAARHQVLALDVPVGPDGRGSLQVPVSGGILDIDLVPAPLAGAGGAVDAEAYVAYVTLLLADGTSMPLPSMVILSEEVALEGPLSDAFHDLAAQAEELHQALLGLQASPADDLIGQVPGLQEQVAALAQQAAFIVAFAQAVADVLTDGAEELLAIFSGTIATIEAAVALLEDGIGRVAEQAEGLPLPTGSPSPAPSPSPSPSPSPTPSSTSSPSPIADLSAAEEAFDDAMADVQAALADLEKELEGVRATIEQAGGVVGEEAGKAAAIVGGTLNGVAMALAGAEAEARRMREAAESQANENVASTQAFLADMQAGIDEALADVAWATDWLEAAQAFAPSAVQGPLGDAQRAVDVANRTAWRLADVVQDQSPAPQDDVESLAAGLQAQVGEAQAAVARAALLIDEVAGSLQPDVSMDDADGMTVCSATADSQACLMYVEPAGEAQVGVVRVLVALPLADPLLVELPGPVGSLTGSITGVPSPTPPPLPTSQPSPTFPPLPTGLPPSSSSSSSSASSSSASASSSPSGSASSSSSSQGNAPAPKLVIEADRDALSARMGEHANLEVTVRNEGAAADVVRLTAQTNAPIAIDTPTESLSIAPGASGKFNVRVTPLDDGSGRLDLIATGDAAGSVKDSVAVTVAPAASAAADLTVSVQPSALEGAVGQSMAITLRIANDGPVADKVNVAVSGTGFQAEPANVEAELGPGESVLREVRVTAVAAGAHDVLIAITSQRGADLQPLVLLDAHSAGGADDGERGKDGGSSAPAKGSPAMPPIAVALAIAVAFALVRRRLR